MWFGLDFSKALDSFSVDTIAITGADKSQGKTWPKNVTGYLTNQHETKAAVVQPPTILLLSSFFNEYLYDDYYQ